MAMTSDEIRETYLSFFEERGHRRLPSAPLVPTAFDPSTLFIIAGMQPLKAYFLGLEQPPHHLLTSCQKVFRMPDIEVIGTTARHLTFFEMLGNFSMGDYFKQGAAEYAWELSLEGFGLDPERIWATVFEGDDELGLGPDEEAIDAWVALGVPRERIVACPRSENFWQAGPTGPCGPCSELYYDRGLEWGKEDDLPGGENERFLEYWNLVFMQFNQEPVGTLKPLPAQNIDTGLGLQRMAILQQDVPTVFETDQFAPLIALARDLATTDDPPDRSLRILADHSRAATMLIADGVVPSNEDRGYVLRRVMRRAIQHGRSIGMEPGFLPQFAEAVIETMGTGYPELVAERAAIAQWTSSEEEGFGRTLESGQRLLDDLIDQAKRNGAEGISGEDAFKLHDTFGFPIELTRELVAEHDLGVGDEDFESAMRDQRTRSRAVGRTMAGADGLGALEGPPSAFTGYESLQQDTSVAAAQPLDDGRWAIKLAESPFYAQGGGQVSDGGAVKCEAGDCALVVEDVRRFGDDQVLVVSVQRGEPRPGERVHAAVDRSTRLATQANHTATHLLHAALRARLGSHVRQAGSYVGPDKLRFDFTHGHGLSAEELADVEDQVNAWVGRNDPVRPMETTLDEARKLGAMALFGEKYGDVVRMVEIGDGEYSRELCGGTHVRATAEIQAFTITSETSSAANVRRIEALTGPGAVRALRSARDRDREVAALLRTTPEDVVAKLSDLQEREKQARKGAGAATTNGASAVDVEALLGQAATVGGAQVLTARVAAPDAKVLLDVLDRVKPKLGDDAAVVLGAATGDKVALVSAVTPSLVERGVRAGEVVKLAAGITGGGGGGRDTMAQAGGRDPGKLDEALEAARAAIESALTA